MKNKKGFTLTEVLVVIVIIGVITAIAIPSIAVIRKRINERTFEAKKEIILVAAEQYSKDNNNYIGTVTINSLVKDGYVKADVNYGSGKCNNTNWDKGCVTNPVNNSIINTQEILLKYQGNSVIAIWDGSTEVTSQALIDEIKTDLDCTSDNNKVALGTCVYEGDNPENYLYNSGVMWRIMGVYIVDGHEVVKMISDDTVVWEE